MKRVSRTGDWKDAMPIVVCAWCNNLVGVKEPLNLHYLTHGICEECKEKIIEEWKEKHETRNCSREDGSCDDVSVVPERGDLRAHRNNGFGL